MPPRALLCSARWYRARPSPAQPLGPLFPRREQPGPARVDRARTGVDRDQHPSQGPQGRPGHEGAFRSARPCSASTWTSRSMGNSPKFACRIGEHRRGKGEVRRRQWRGVTARSSPLGCSGRWGLPPTQCIRSTSSAAAAPTSLGGTERADGRSRFDPAMIERKFAGHEWPHHGRRAGRGASSTRLRRTRAARTRARSATR